DRAADRPLCQARRTRERHRRQRLRLRHLGGPGRGRSAGGLGQNGRHGGRRADRKQAVLGMNESPQPAPITGLAESRQPVMERMLGALTDNLVRPILSFRLSYLPVLMVYFAYGALGMIALTQTFWVKESLTFTPAQLAGLAVWFGLPWTIKMVFGELVDCV